MNTFFSLVVRALVMYFFILFSTRLLGKREIGQVSPFDFVVAIMLGELAVLSIENTKLPLWEAIIPIAVIVAAHIGVALLSLKSNLARSVFSGVPTMVIENGQIIERNLRALRCNVNDLLANLREKGIWNIADVEFAIMENSGKLSVVQRSQCRPATPADLGLPTRYEGVSTTLIVDGKMLPRSLARVKLDRRWLISELSKRGIEDPREVLLASLDTFGNLFVALHQKKGGGSGQDGGGGGGGGGDTA